MGDPSPGAGSGSFRRGPSHVRTADLGEESCAHSDSEKTNSCGTAPISAAPPLNQIYPEPSGRPGPAHPHRAGWPTVGSARHGSPRPRVWPRRNPSRLAPITEVFLGESPAPEPALSVNSADNSCNLWGCPTPADTPTPSGRCPLPLCRDGGIQHAPGFVSPPLLTWCWGSLPFPDSEIAQGH